MSMQQLDIFESNYFREQLSKTQQNTIVGKFLNYDVIPYSLKDVWLIKADNDEKKAIFQLVLKRFHYFSTKRYNSVEYLIILGKELDLTSPLIEDLPSNLIGIISVGYAIGYGIKCRDIKIGWDAEMKKENMKYLGEETRFQILPFRRQKNTISYVMSIFFKIVQKDTHFKVLQAFVDKKNYKGTGYGAGGWEYCGDTKNGDRKIFIKMLDNKWAKYIRRETDVNTK